MILAPVEVVGVDGFGEWAVTLKLRIKTMPLKQWEVGRELTAADPEGASSEHGIEHPVPGAGERHQPAGSETGRAVGPEGQ